MNILWHLLLLLRGLAYFLVLVVVSNPTQLSLLSLVNEHRSNTIHQNQKVNVRHVENKMNNMVSSVGKGIENSQDGLKELASTNSVTTTLLSPNLTTNGSTPSFVSSLKSVPPNGYLSTFFDKIVMPTTKPVEVSSATLPSMGGNSSNSSNSTKTTSQPKRRGKKRKWRSETIEVVPVVSATARYIQQKRYDDFLQALDAQFYVRPEFTVNHIPHKESGLGNVIYGVMSTSFIASVTGRSFHSKFECLFV